MEIRIEDTFDDTNFNYKAVNPLQLYNWGKVKLTQNWTYLNISIWDKSLISNANVLLKKVPKTTDYIAFVPFGPNYSKELNFMRKKEVIIELAKYLKENHNVKLLKLHEYDGEMADYGIGANKSFKMLYDETYIIDLTLSEDQLFMNLHKKLRNEIKKGIKNGTKVIKSNTSDGLDMFYELHKKTFDRSKYKALDKSFFDSVYCEYIKSGRGDILLAFSENELISGAIIIESSNTSLYMWGASTGDREYNKYEGQKVLLWNAILKSKQNGKLYFDLGGVTSNAEKGSKREGIYTFKKKFGGEYRKFSGTYNIYLCKIRGRVYDVLLKLYLSRK